MKTVNELVAERNAINAQISAIESKMESENSIILMEEVANLLHGVGEGFTSGDYYAPDRYYSRIPGVKNIRVYDYQENIISIKLVFDVPLPKSIIIDGTEYSLEKRYSKTYTFELMY